MIKGKTILLYYLLPVFLISLIASCAKMPANTMAMHKQIICGPGPEDMELDSSAGKPRLIISCNQRRKSTNAMRYDPFGEIMEYGFDGKAATVMVRQGGPTGSLFNPHGISIATVNGKRLLYVVNHSRPVGKPQENHIEVYEIDGSYLNYVKSISGPELISPNDCFATTNGDVYFTNDSGGKHYLWEKLWKLKKSTVYCVRADSARVLVADKLAYANGVYVEDLGIMGDYVVKTPTGTDTVVYPMLDVYISTVQQKALYKSIFVKEVDERYKAENIMPVNGQDNIMKCGDKLVVACHPKPFKFLKHAMNPDKKSPVHVYAYDLKTGTYSLIFADDGGRISTGSTAILYKGKLYISQVFQPFILEVDMSGK